MSPEQKEKIARRYRYYKDLEQGGFKFDEDYDDIEDDGLVPKSRGGFLRR